MKTLMSILVALSVVAGISASASATFTSDGSTQEILKKLAIPQP